MQNPFFYGTRINDANRFCDRIDDEAALYSFASRHVCCSLIGESCIGKSSLLKHMSLRSTVQRFSPDYDVDPDTLAMVFVDLPYAAARSPNELWGTLVYETARSVADLQVASRAAVANLRSTQHRSELAFPQASEYLAELKDAGIRLVILLDGFEYLANRSGFDQSFFGQLRSLADGSSLSYVTGSAYSLLDLTYSNQSAKESPFFTIFNAHTLRLFSLDAARSLLRHPIDGYTTPFADEDIEFLIDLAGPHPFFLQWAGSLFFDQHRSRSGKIEGADRQRVQTVFDEQTSNHFRYFWGKLDNQERRALYQVVQGVAAPPIPPAVATSLLDHSLVYAVDGRLTVFSRAFERFIRSQPPTGNEPVLQELPAEIADSLTKLMVRYFRYEGYVYEPDPPPIKSKQVTLFQLVLRKQGPFRSAYIFLDIEQQYVYREVIEFLHRVEMSDTGGRLGAHFRFLYVTLRSEVEVDLPASIEHQKKILPHRVEIWYREQIVHHFQPYQDLRSELMTLLRSLP